MSPSIPANYLSPFKPQFATVSGFCRKRRKQEWSNGANIDEQIAPALPPCGNRLGKWGIPTEPHHPGHRKKSENLRNSRSTRGIKYSREFPRDFCDLSPGHSSTGLGCQLSFDHNEATYLYVDLADEVPAGCEEDSGGKGREMIYF
ncbi:hypothetical protein KM043_013705 [Ampulex compressa]|nr:hypothetical protein KM043_013705 [Ampulex compressa]